jgi:hypothetical protein
VHLGQSRILWRAGRAWSWPGVEQPGPDVKVAANQAWFEYIPARVKAPSGTLAEFRAAGRQECRDQEWDKNDLGSSRTTSSAIRSLIAYRTLRYGRHLDLIITDQYSFQRRRCERLTRHRQDLRSGVRGGILRDRR